jgi:benzodiazapine receptor
MTEIEVSMSQPTRDKQIIGFIIWLAISFSAAGIGAVASVTAADFYMQLVRPMWAPPAALFGPVWMTLYALMGISAWMIWRVAGFAAAKTALTLFLIQLAVNALWSWVFFVWHLGVGAFVNIVVLWVLITATLISFWRIRVLAAVLLIPYLLWVSFAAALNFSIWQLNPLLLGQ